MGLQVSSDLDSEIPEKNIIGRSEKVSWWRCQSTGTTKSVQRFRRLFHDSGSTMDTNHSKIKQPYCSVFKQLDDWMTTKTLNSNVNFPLFHLSTGNW